MPITRIETTTSINLQSADTIRISVESRTEPDYVPKLYLTNYSSLDSKSCCVTLTEEEAILLRFHLEKLLEQI